MFSKKLRLLLIPYFIISLATIGLYTACCLQVYNKQGTIEIPEEILQFWIPMTLPWIPVLIWLRPGIKLLKMKRDGRGSPDFGIMFIIVLCMTIPMMEISFYLEEYCGDLTPLDRISDINSHPPTEYYRTDTFYIDKEQFGLYYSSYTSGRFNSTFNLEIHIVCPMYDRKYNWFKEDTTIGIVAPPQSPANPGNNKSDSMVLEPPAIAEDADNGYPVESLDVNVRPSAWIGVHYNTSMGNMASDAKKKEREHEFYRQCVAKFDDSDMNHFSYLQRVPDNDHRSYYRKAIIQSSDTLKTDHAIVLEGGYGNFETRTGHRLLWIFLTYAIATILFATIIYFIKFDENRLALFEEQKSTGDFIKHQ